MIFFSIILATLNRKESLRNAVNSILKQTHQKFEIIIVDQSEYIDKEIQKIDSRIQYIHTEQKGLSHARNLALNFVRGNYICLLDDDAIYDSNFLLIANEILNKEYFTILSGAIIDPQNNKYGQKWMDGKEMLLKFRHCFKYCMSSAMVIESIFLKKYRFDEKFGIGGLYESAEETDVVMLAIENKKKVMFCPDLRVYHKVQGKSEIDLKTANRYARGAGAIYKKHIYIGKKGKVFAMFICMAIKHLVGIIIYKGKKRKYYQSLFSGEIDGFLSYER